MLEAAQITMEGNGELQFSGTQSLAGIGTVDFADNLVIPDDNNFPERDTPRKLTCRALARESPFERCEPAWSKRFASKNALKLLLQQIGRSNLSPGGPKRDTRRSRARTPGNWCGVCSDSAFPTQDLPARESASAPWRLLGDQPMLQQRSLRARTFRAVGPCLPITNRWQQSTSPTAHAS
jgi:hypothetical protein